MYSTATELIQVADCFYRPTPFMGQRILVARMAVAPFSPSTPTGRVLERCIVSRLVLWGPTPMEPIRLPIWFYQATPYMGRATKAVPTTPAPYSPLISMGRLLEFCIAFQHLFLLIIPTATEAVCS